MSFGHSDSDPDLDPDPDGAVHRSRFCVCSLIQTNAEMIEILPAKSLLQIKVEDKYENLTNVIVVTFKKLSEFLHHYLFLIQKIL